MKNKSQFIRFHGISIRVENAAGTTRTGRDESTGVPWSTKMPVHYGEIVGSHGVDGEPVDVFVGNFKGSKFVYVCHQLNRHTGEFDEDKVFLGFKDLMDAKATYHKSYDNPQLFTGSWDTVPLAVFKKKVMQTKNDPVMIHAAILNSPSGGKGIGEEVVVNGMMGRGVVVRRNGRKVTVKFRSGVYITRDIREVHLMSDNTVSKMWRE